MARKKFTPELREEYLRTLAQCGRYALCNKIHGISKTTVCRAKVEVPGFRKRCERAVRAFEQRIAEGSVPMSA